ncbi:transposase [Aureimonas ureilytica]|nr:transposase [Aureimonas ureilytica]
MRKAEKLHRHSAGQEEIAASIEAMVEMLTRQISDLDRRIADLIQAPLADQAHLLLAVPGIGRTVLATLLGELPELGTLCRRRIASLAGLAPHARESGTWRGARRIWGGRRKVREALYIVALSASRNAPVLEERLRLMGKAPKTILIAVARQFLVNLNAMLRSKTPIALA